MVGKWEQVGGDQILDFSKDGTVTIIEEGGTRLGGDYEFINENEVKISFPLFGTIVAKLSPSRDKITLTNLFGKIEKYRRVKQRGDILGEYIFEGGIVGEKAKRESGIFLFNKDGTISYVPLGKRRIDTPFTWRLENRFAHIFEGKESLFNDGKLENGDIVYDKFGTLARFVKRD